jgi:hypothetical protein
VTKHTSQYGGTSSKLRSSLPSVRAVCYPFSLMIDNHVLCADPRTVSMGIAGIPARTKDAPRAGSRKVLRKLHTWRI